MSTMLTRRGGISVAVAALAASIVRAHAAKAVVTIDNFTFSPDTLTVSPGTKVTFTNRDDMPHTVTSAVRPPLFRSPPMDTGESFAFTFESVGSYSYFCSIHPHMTGRVIVR